MLGGKIKKISAEKKKQTFIPTFALLREFKLAKYLI